MRRTWGVVPICSFAMGLATTPVLVAGAIGCEEPCAQTDTVVQVWIPEVTAAAGSRVSVRVRLDLGTPDLALAGAAGILRFEPAVLTYEGAAPVAEGPEPRVDPTLAAAGIVSFEVGREPPAPPLERGTILELWFRVVGSPGVRADVVVEMRELIVTPGGMDVLAGATIRGGAVHIH